MSNMKDRLTKDMPKYIQVANCYVKQHQKDFQTRVVSYFQKTTTEYDEPLKYVIVYQSTDKTIFAEDSHGYMSSTTWMCPTEQFNVCFKKL